MKIVNSFFGQAISGIVISIAAQYFGLLLTSLFPIGIQQLDPAASVIYSSIGLIISLIFAIYFSWRKSWALVGGVLLGVLLWWPFLLVWMTITGTWL